MQENIRELKKRTFLELKDEGYTFDEIKKVLGVSERTLFNWQNEESDENYQVGVKRDTIKELKKKAFVELRRRGFTFDEIRRSLGCTERTLYRWQNEIDNVGDKKETEQKTDEEKPTINPKEAEIHLSAEPGITKIEKPIDAIKAGVDYAPYCTSWEYNMSKQMPDKVIMRMAKRGSISKRCGAFILEQRRKTNEKESPGTFDEKTYEEILNEKRSPDKSLNEEQHILPIKAEPSKLDIDNKIFQQKPLCPRCGSSNTKKHGFYRYKNKKLSQRLFCNNCRKGWSRRLEKEVKETS